MPGDGRIQALSLPLTWDRSVVEPVAMLPGDLLQQHGGRNMVLSPEPGTVDAALFGVADLGICGEGLLATVTFQVKAPGDANISVGEIRARDAKNQEIGLEPTVDEKVPTVLPSRTVLNSAMPNPFNPLTKVSFTLPRDANVVVDIYDMRGRLVQHLVDDDFDPGLHEIDWLGRDDSGRSVSAGVYFSRMRSDGFVQTRKMTLVR